MRGHSVTGAELLASADDFDCRQTAIEIARSHHEWWSGAGYPDGLAGESIPIAARIVALAEVFDALTHDRPYRPRLSVDRALELITERAGYQFDPSLVPPFCSMIRELRRNFGELDPQLERSTEQSTFLNAKLRLTERLRRLSS
jgi:putative two-component system response regulator